MFSLWYPRGTKGSLKKNSANLEQPFGYIYKYIYMSEELYIYTHIDYDYERDEIFMIFSLLLEQTSIEKNLFYF